MSRGLALFFLLALAGCGGAGRGTPARSAYPVLARVPAKATFVLAATRLSAASRLARDLVSLVEPAAVSRIDSDLTTYFGASALDAASLADVGFDPEGNVVVFGTHDGGFSVLLPVARRERVDDFLRKQTENASGETREHAGTTMQRYRFDGEWFTAFAHLGPYLAIHVGRVDAAPQGTEWLDEIVDPRDRFEAIEETDGFLVADVPAVDRELARKADPQCAEPRRAFASRWGKVVARARFAPGQLHATVAVELPAAVRRNLETHQVEIEPSYGNEALRATWRVDLAWLAQRDAPGPVCKGLMALGDTFDLALLAGLLPGIRAFDVTVASARTSGDQVDLEAEAVILAAPDALPSVTSRLGGGAPLETAGDLGRAKNPSLLRPVEWTPAGAGLRVWTGPRGKEGRLILLPLAALHYTGGKIPDLVPLARAAQSLLFGVVSGPGPLVQLLGRIDTLDVTASLADPGLTLSLDLVLRP